MSEELIDPQTVIREECKQSSNCRSFLEKYEACDGRQSKTNESCEEEFIDLLECTDKCVASQLFRHLK
ncbi:hypothetical protein EG68_06433 [Paragonimus skrjabini miyazakii]|uniref:Ubiquinol-cytochrome C reductase hinge domain-containing protein n=1 Tax=Paragonimus skrjabini miyazakii TaxID=59628 RepID=A0A8S9YN81_9TREM|nr:hypothetical protein EG68_06433 [Paragonimus skrjabini miyazakii]